jgi:thiazolylpeptide-type bacteriocin precursor
MLQQSLGYDLRQLDVETFEVEEINDVGIDAPAIGMDEIGDTAFAATSSSCSTSSCCSCSTSSCCSTSTSTSSCG